MTPSQSQNIWQTQATPLRSRSWLTLAGATLSIAITGITRNKGRAALTLLGIVIGIAAVICAIAIGNGSQQQVNQRLSALGTNLVTVQPGGTSSGGVRGGIGSASTLTLANAIAMAEQVGPGGVLPDVASIAPEDTTQVQAVIGANNTSTTAVGLTPEDLNARSYHVAVGSFISAADVQHATQVCDLGATLVTTLFPAGGAASAIGSTVLLNGQAYQVIGVMATSGGFGNIDSDVFVPLTAVEQRLSQKAGAADAVTAINLVATAADKTTAVQAEVESFLRQLHKLSARQADDFSFFNQTSVQQTASSVSDTLTILLGAISAVSLLVAGIGIMNIMLVTVTERTREIGLRKALGARRIDILTQFLTESTIISVVGGLLGVFCSYLVVWILPKTGFSSAPPVITSTSVILAVGVSLMIGLFFGSYPASRAAALDPIQALRYE
jgi:putative ABC transport system permease protein